MPRRPGSVDLTHEQLLQAIALLNGIERAAFDVARDRPELDEFVGNVRLWLREAIESSRAVMSAVSVSGLVSYTSTSGSGWITSSI